MGLCSYAVGCQGIKKTRDGRGSTDVGKNMLEGQCGRRGELDDVRWETEPCIFLGSRDKPMHACLIFVT